MPGPDAPRLNPVVRFISTGAYLGYSPIAPGTAGAFGCAVLYWLLAPEVTPVSPPVSIAVLCVSLGAFIALAVWASGEAERAFGKDSSRIVIDEFAGLLVAVFLLPKSVFVLLVAFLLFRILDIVKPFPAKRMEALRGGAGVVLDDVVAGVYANVLLRLMLLARGW